MIIYEFTTWGSWHSNNGLFSINEMEVQEKPKTYIGKGFRINKDDIDVLQRSYGNRMYRLDKDATPYIEAMIKLYCSSIESLERRLASERATLQKWEALKDGVEE